ncbi:formyltransferase family protein [Thermodesulfobacteriota bacterium]
MKLRPLYNPDHKKTPMKVAAFMSGTGSNIKMLIKKGKELEKAGEQSPFKVVFIFSDRSDGKCHGEDIACSNGIPYFSYDIRKFHDIRNIKRTALTQEGFAARKEFDSIPLELVKAFQIDLIALGGYMSFTTLEGCINVHPADLSIHSPDGKRKYTGDNAVYDAILDGEKSLRSSTLWTDLGVDTGPLLMVSRPTEVILPEPVESLKKNKKRLLEIVDSHQERLKEIGDWEIFPRTVELIAEGRFAFDDDNRVYVDGNHVPEGFRE